MLNRTVSSSFLALVGALVSAPGCGDDSSSGGGPGTGSTQVKTGLPAEVLLSGLSGPDAVALCEAEVATAEAALNPNELCSMSGLLGAVVVAAFDPSADTKALCEAGRDACLADNTASDCTEATVLADLQGCEITVSEFEACQSAQLKQAQEGLKGLTCASSLETVSSLQSSDPPQCAGLDQRCPSMFAQSSSAPSSSEPSASGCDDTCAFSNDDECDDGGEGSATGFCGLGTDCNDCGARAPAG